MPSEKAAPAKKPSAPSAEELLGVKKPVKPEKKKAASKKVKHKSTHIEHHDNGTHTMRHTPRDGGPEVSYSVPDLDGVHDGLEENLGAPNQGEGAANEPEPAA